jgi:hypothetical protein
MDANEPINNGIRIIQIGINPKKLGPLQNRNFHGREL